MWTVIAIIGWLLWWVIKIAFYIICALMLLGIAEDLGGFESIILILAIIAIIHFW